ncbi:MAG: helix-turn-helix domain-containing protein [Geminicoccales bacterium]
MREARQRKGWTLETTATETGVARSTLSKIENGQTSPGFEIIQKLAAKFEFGLPQLFTPARRNAPWGRRVVTLKGQELRRSTPTYDHELLCTELVDKGMLPYFSRIKARSFSDFDDWIRHDGEEFLLVMEGEVELPQSSTSPYK